MTANNSYAGTAAIRALADAALMSASGITIKCETHGEAMKIRQRFNDLRFRERKVNSKLLSPEDPKYNTSAYDPLEAKILSDGVTIVVQTGEASFNKLVITDIATGKQLGPEDLW